MRAVADRRVLAAAAALAALALVLAVALSGGGAPYRFAAEFDTAKGMVGGQQVKIAGAVVGSVDSVELTAERRARMAMSIDPEFGPLATDTTCRILPEGLISESYVECDPGAASEPLPAGEEGLPTVPVKSTSTPLALQDLLNVFAQPTSMRLRVLLNEMGISTVGRGEDLNALLRRSNPALGEARKVLAVLDEQRDQLAGAVEQTDAVLARLGERSSDVRRFVDRAAAVAEATASERDDLGEAIRRMPALLDEARPGLASIDRAAAKASPLLEQLERSGPGLERLTSTLPAFAGPGRAALRRLERAAATGRGAVSSLAPAVGALERSTPPVTRLASELDEFLVSVRDTGGIDGLMRVLYAFPNFTSMYDRVSHLMSFHIAFAPHCLVLEKSPVEFPGCSHKYNAPHQGRVPINDPGCGPKDGVWKDERCDPPPPGGGIFAGLPFDVAGVLESLGGDGAELRRALNSLGEDGDGLVDALMRDIRRKRAAGEPNPERGGLAGLGAMLDFLFEEDEPARSGPGRGGER